MSIPNNSTNILIGRLLGGIINRDHIGRYYIILNHILTGIDINRVDNWYLVDWVCFF